MIIFKNGKIVKGTNPRKHKTGCGHAVKIIKVNEQLFGLMFLGKVYHLNELDFFEYPKTENEIFAKEVSDINWYSNPHPFFGFEIGDVFLSKYVFIGYNKDKKTSKFFILVPDNGAGEALDNISFTDQELIQKVSSEKQKALSIYYLNTNGEKTKADVNSLEEIKDMKELIYKIEN